MKRLVIDASILVKLFFAEVHSDAAVRAVNSATELFAPDLLWAEAANVVWKRLHRKQLSAADAAALLEDMLRVPVLTSGSGELAAAALALAAQTGRTVYDCLYLALALREEIPLLTADERLANALAPTQYGKRVRFVGVRT